MRDTSLLQLGLGLTPPWTVIRAAFDAEARRLDIQIDFPSGTRFVCPACGAANWPTYDTARRTWRHLNFFQHLTPRWPASSVSTTPGCGASFTTTSSRRGRARTPPA